MGFGWVVVREGVSDKMGEVTNGEVKLIFGKGVLLMQWRQFCVRLVKHRNHYAEWYLNEPHLGEPAKNSSNMPAWS